MEIGERNFLWNVAIGHLNNGDAALNEGRINDAWTEYERAEALIQRVRETWAGDREMLRDLTLAWERLGDVARAQGDIDMAFARYDACLDVRRQLAASSEMLAQRDLCIAYTKLAWALDAKGDWAGSRDTLDAARQAILPFAMEYPDDLARVERFLTRMEAFLAERGG
ncbi:hypothetical protein P1X14_20950 [Sphingomonas sp. AOB5]|uniref:hypothetical protein n=1 Tax=Sphingomonas sp. AOB5 TaxID=3034017 RepID=UPI0023F925E0|nr:hypothetical protein [Sphingomonas sp. AOB5]MDF7777737.1 hypothetical protein [Sphingomonas sp. AOB5]